MSIREGQRVRLPGQRDFWTVDYCRETNEGLTLYVRDLRGVMSRHDVLQGQVGQILVLDEDGQGDAATVLAGLWAAWMQAATLEASATALASRRSAAHFYASGLCSAERVSAKPPRS